MKSYMKLMPKKILYLISLFVVMLVYACSTDDTPAPIIDAEKPVITIVAPTDLTNPLRATVTLKAEATDNTGIAKVEVFVNGTSIASATSSPVEASWDTKTVADGSHVIKIVAEDAEGNKEEKSISVEVKNILFTFPVGAAYISENTEQWIFISDESGALISVKQLVNGETYIVNTPEGFNKDKRYYFTRLQYFADDIGSFIDSYFVTYANVKPGTYKLDFELRTIPEVVGSHTIFVSGSPTDNLRENIVSLDARNGYYYGALPALTPIVVGAKASLYKSPADLLYFFYNVDDEDLGKNLSPLYYRFPSVVDGGEDIVPYASLNSMDFHTINFTGATESYYSISSLPKAGEYQNMSQLIYQFNYVSPNELKVYTPELEFPEYRTSMSYKSGNTEYFYEKVSTQIPTDFKHLQGSISDFSKSENKITIQANGTYTHTATSCYKFSVEDNGDVNSYGWVIYGPKGSTIEFIIPEIPAEIISKHPGVSSATYDFGDPTLYNYIGLPDYDAVVDARFTGKSIYKEAKELSSLTSTFPGSGGRIGNKQKEWLRSRNLPIDFMERRNQ